LARALFDHFGEAMVVFDADGRLSYANASGQATLDRLAGGGPLDTSTLLQRLGRLGGRVERITAGGVLLGHAVYVTGPQVTDTLAERERQAILAALTATGWRFTETARRLGISRTTLWRRLREWGIEPPASAGMP
jgi:transcriptional regulator of acetoin/glycerol metabolism